MTGRWTIDRQGQMQVLTTKKAFWLFLSVFLTLCLLSLNQGCSYRGWYEGFKERERRQCYDNPDNSALEACLDRVNSMSYEQYRRSTGKTDQ